MFKLFHPSSSNHFILLQTISSIFSNFNSLSKSYVCMYKFPTHYENFSSIFQNAFLPKFISCVTLVLRFFIQRKTFHVKFSNWCSGSWGPLGQLSLISAPKSAVWTRISVCNQLCNRVNRDVELGLGLQGRRRGRTTKYHSENACFFFQSFRCVRSLLLHRTASMAVGKNKRISKGKKGGKKKM
jgi:hypothetical protein